MQDKAKISFGFPRRLRVTFGYWYKISQELTQDQFEQMIAGADILEKDPTGAKVFRLQTGSILKIFRVKHLISSARLYSHARSFCRNARRLNAIGIPTVKVQQLFHFKDSSNSAVLYEPLIGDTYSDLARRGEVDREKLEKLGRFIARLHANGIFFRSLHLGNIVYTPEGNLGLIDVADMNIYPYPLGMIRVIRNFNHLTRLKKHWQGQTPEMLRGLVDSYINTYKPARLAQKRILSLFKLNQ